MHIILVISVLLNGSIFGRNIFDDLNPIQEWTRYDIQQGFLQALSALSSKLILVMLDTIKLSDLDAKLR